MSPTKLKNMRFESRCSQSRLAQAATVSRFKVSQFELGYADLTAHEIRRIKSAIKQMKAELRRASLKGDL
jgi:predicted transcriptional regulator